MDTNQPFVPEHTSLVVFPVFVFYCCIARVFRSVVWFQRSDVSRRLIVYPSNLTNRIQSRGMLLLVLLVLAHFPAPSRNNSIGVIVQHS